MGVWCRKLWNVLWIKSTSDVSCVKKCRDNTLICCWGSLEFVSALLVIWSVLFTSLMGAHEVQIVDLLGSVFRFTSTCLFEQGFCSSRGEVSWRQWQISQLLKKVVVKCCCEMCYELKERVTSVVWKNVESLLLWKSWVRRCIAGNLECLVHKFDGSSRNTSRGLAWIGFSYYFNLFFRARVLFFTRRSFLNTVETFTAAQESCNVSSLETQHECDEIVSTRSSKKCRLSFAFPQPLFDFFRGMSLTQILRALI